jgi:membrane-associated phospholipid phosphatase
LSKLLSDIAELPMYIVIILSYFVWGGRARSFFYILILVFITFFISIGKIVLHSPRPYMVSDDIEAYGCSKEYGNPSGHSLGASAMLITILLDYLKTYPNAAEYKKLLLGIGNIIAIVTIGFSRLYNGAHSLN